MSKAKTLPLEILTAVAAMAVAVLIVWSIRRGDGDAEVAPVETPTAEAAEESDDPIVDGVDEASNLADEQEPAEPEPEPAEPEPEPIVWLDNYEEGLALAIAERRPFVAVIYGPNCGPCKQWKDNVQHSSILEEEMRAVNAVCVYASTDQDPQRRRDYPWMYVKPVNGGIYGPINIYTEPKAFVAWVKNFL